MDEAGDATAGVYDTFEFTPAPETIGEVPVAAKPEESSGRTLGSSAHAALIIGAAEAYASAAAAGRTKEARRDASLNAGEVIRSAQLPRPHPKFLVGTARRPQKLEARLSSSGAPRRISMRA